MFVPRVHASFMYLFIQFTDVNECELEAYPCSPNANCTDADGSFNCTCREGFEGDGFNCTGISTLSIFTVTDMYLVNFFYILSQTFQSVKEHWITVTQMRTVQTQLEVITAFATLDSLEMDLHVQVSNHHMQNYTLCAYYDPFTFRHQ